MLSRLEYADGTTWKPLPDWASFYWQLGARVARWDSPTHRAVCVLSIPTRDFAAPIVTAGYLAARSVAAQLADEEAFPVGSTILFESGNGLWNLGRITERTHHPLVGPSFAVQIAKNNRRIISTCKVARFVRSTESFDPERRSKPARPRSAVASSDFCHALLSGGAPVYLRSERPRSVIVGPLTILESECQAPIWRVAEENATPGSLGDLLRVHELLDAHEPWHTRILSSRLTLDGSSTPDLVVLDGTSALTRGRTQFEGSDQIFILDRSSTTTDEACRIALEEQRSRDPGVIDGDPLSPPVGVTYTVFFRRRRH
jgi:hypothetical protein